MSSIYNNQEVLVLDSAYLLANSNTIKFTTLKFYITNIRLYKNEKIVWQEKHSFHLYDASEEARQSFQIDVPAKIQYTHIAFNLGIDSLTNVSGAMGGDLDPTKGMYWTWQSGYINFKLEGTSSLITNPKKEFQFHLGGYMHPFNTLQNVYLKIKQPGKINVLFDVKRFLEAIELTSQHHIMSPNTDAVKLSEATSKCFSVQ